MIIINSTDLWIRKNASLYIKAVNTVLSNESRCALFIKQHTQRTNDKYHTKAISPIKNSDDFAITKINFQHPIQSQAKIKPKRNQTP